MDKIILNVGGKLYETTKTTLVSTGPYFRNLCYPESSFQQQEAVNGIYFIDRDPVLFGYLLGFARTERLPPTVEDLEGLYIEAEYFEYDKLMQYLERKSGNTVGDAKKCSRNAQSQHDKMQSEIRSAISGIKIEMPDVEMPNYSEQLEKLMTILGGVDNHQIMPESLIGRLDQLVKEVHNVAIALGNIDRNINERWNRQV